MSDRNASRHENGQWLVDGGEMGKFIRAKDWSLTPLGPIDLWPESLKTTVSLCLASNFPINLIWGPQHTQIINDGYWPICGAIYEQVMGANYRDSWASAWSAIGDAFEQALGGKTSFLENQRMYLDRNGYLEESFFTFSHSPIRDDNGAVVGLFHPVTETTARMLSERRSKSVRELTAALASAKTVDEVFAVAGQNLGEDNYDISFACLYAFEDGSSATLKSSTGIQNDPLFKSQIRVDLEEPHPFHLKELAEHSRPTLLKLTEWTGLVILGSDYPEPVTAIRILPLNRPGSSHAAGAIVLGASPRLPFNELYEDYYGLLASAISSALANAFAAEQERSRLEEMAALDLAKTTFFSNISHEFRTPLTLILVPLEELLAESDLIGKDRDTKTHEKLKIIHRNSLRLLKLVNTLLDFSRIEAGRFQASFEKTDLVIFTQDLVSSFRSVATASQLELAVEADVIEEPVFVDREMWEKIILNLLSNAFKYTIEGSITVSIRDQPETVEVSVADTGTGILESELPRLFERFYRVKGAEGRNYEGSGIGLAMVSELVNMHKGSIRVKSEKNRGSEFIITIPKGSSHLAPEQIAKGSQTLSRSTREMFALEAETYVEPKPNAETSVDAAMKASDTRPRVLLVDDNPDMRQYIKQILQDAYRVVTAQDGEDALLKIREERPDLVLSDIMMPRLDGYGLLTRIRKDEKIKTLPIILVSARAGDEAKVEGLETGADDYLTKPFSAKELKARVASHLTMARIRQEASLREAELLAEAFAANRSNQLKDEFLATVSHELRTPMNAITGFSALLLEEEPGSEEFELAVSAIFRNAEQQNRIVNDLLDISQILTGKLALKESVIQPADVLRSAIESVSLSARSKDIRIVVKADSQVNSILGDAGRLQQAIWNVLANSIRFSAPNSEIVLEVKNEGPKVLIRIVDTGEGMSPEFVPYAFDSLRQEDGSFARKHGGLGLGLSLVKQIVEAHGGEVSAKSLGKNYGTSVTIALPIVDMKGEEDRVEQVERKKTLQGLKVLAVDDEQDSRLLVRAILRRAGAETLTASSASEAVHMLENYHPDVIISDIGMPEENGYQFLMQLRASQSSSSRVPAVALTAWTRDEDRKMAFDAGFQDHLAKPVSAGALEAAVARLASYGV